MRLNLIFLCSIFCLFFLIPSSLRAEQLTEFDLQQLELVKRFKIARSRMELLSLLPVPLHSCIGTEVTGGKLWSSLNTEQGQYHYIGLFESDNYYEYSEIIFKVSDLNCQALTPIKTSEAISYLSYLPDSIVIPLLVNKYQKELKELGGMDAFNLRNFSDFGDPTWEHYLTEEQLKALELLGIKLPSTRNVFIISPSGIYPLNPNNN